MLDTTAPHSRADAADQVTPGGAAQAGHTTLAIALQSPTSAFLHELVQQGVLAEAQLAEVLGNAAALGTSVPAYLLARGLATRAALYAAVWRLPGGVVDDFDTTLRSITDVPQWGAILNDAGGPLGGPVRHEHLVVIVTPEDADAARLEGRQAACFLLATREAMASNACFALASKATALGHDIRARLILDSDEVARVLWSQWDERSGHRSVATRQSAGPAGARAPSTKQQFFDTIAQEAYRQGASDIHLIARDGTGGVLLRVDGDVYRQPYELTSAGAIEIAAAVYDSMTDNNSVRSGFSVHSRQDGSVDRFYPDGRLRFRYSGAPVEPDGYHVAMRIIPIDEHKKPKTLLELGYPPAHAASLDRAFSRAEGLVLICGPTGAGKSNTLANRLATLIADRPHKLVLTLEEPVEQIIPGAYQSSVKRQVGEDGQSAFQQALSSIMRLDPDVIMQGEIRDLQTADLAIQGVRSGHLLLSTLHTGNALSAYDRFDGLGVPRKDMATVDLVAAIARQALTQTLCTYCRIPAHEYLRTAAPAERELGERLRAALGRGDVPSGGHINDALDGVYFRNPAGCEHCRHRGITGRTACAEVFAPSAVTLPLIAKGDSIGLWRAWRATINPRDEDDMTGRTAREHGMWRMAHGQVAPDEVERQFRRFDEPLAPV